MRPYAELLEFNQPNPIRRPGFTRIRDAFPGLAYPRLVSQLRESGFQGYTESVGDIYHDPERIMEFAGRWDYGENNARRLGETVTVARSEHFPAGAGIDGGTRSKHVEVPIIQKYIGMGHESMIEMGWATFFLECSRVVSHELVRHRLASFQQESQRFVKYDSNSPMTGWLENMYVPDGLDDMAIFPSDYVDDNASAVVYRAYQAAWVAYQQLRAHGVAPQLARYVLPNGFRTRIIMSANIREWRHILKLRLDKSAQPEMQELMQQVYDQLSDVFPNALHGVLDKGRGVR